MVGKPLGIYLSYRDQLAVHRLDILPLFLRQMEVSAAELEKFVADASKCICQIKP